MPKSLREKLQEFPPEEREAIERRAKELVAQERAEAPEQLEDRTDSGSTRNMSEAEIEQNARDDPDNLPAIREELAQAKHIPPEQQQ